MEVDDDEVTNIVSNIQDFLSSYTQDTQVSAVNLLAALVLPEQPASVGCQGCAKKLNIYF